jgi:hypothetical protein
VLYTPCLHRFVAVIVSESAFARARHNEEVDPAQLGMSGCTDMVTDAVQCGHRNSLVVNIDGWFFNFDFSATAEA